MASQVSGDLTKIQAGPCKLTYRGVDLGHTIGGCMVTVENLTRDRDDIDEYEGEVVDSIHAGDKITINVKLAEKSPEVIAALFPFGVSVTEGWGIGQRPGSRGSDVSGTLVIHPLDGDGLLDDVVLHDAVASDQGDIENDKLEDREFDATFVSIIDDRQQAGMLLGGFGDPTLEETEDAFILSDESEFTFSDGSVFVLI
jgi:hypothetical protein